MNQLEKLSAVWYWAQGQHGISPEFVQQHIQNMENALNKGLTIVPSVTFDCHGTLVRGDENNKPLYNLGKDVCAHETLSRQLTLASRIASAPMVTAECLDDDFNGATATKLDHDAKLSSWKKEVYELLVDDQGMDSSHSKSYVTVCKPTWNSQLIRFPS